MGREQVVLASCGAPACVKHGCHDRPEAEPRPCGVPRPPRGMPPGRPRWPPAEPRPRSLRSPALCWWALSGGLLGISWRRTRNGQNPRPDVIPRSTSVGQTRRGERGEWQDRRSPQRASTSPSRPPADPHAMTHFDPTFHGDGSAHWRFCGSPFRAPRHRSRRTPTARAGDISKPNAASKSSTRLATINRRRGEPQACATPSTAGQVPAGLPAKPGPGKTWTSQARPRLPQAHQQQLCSQNCRSCSGLDTSIANSVSNRVRLSEITAAVGFMLFYDG